MSYKFPSILTLPRTTTVYGTGGTNTFRSSSSTLFDGKFVEEAAGHYGSNLQNIEASMREMYPPDKGYKMAQRDQDGAEARIVAYLADRGLYRDLFENGIKVHVYVALHMFKDRWKEKYPTLDVDGACELKPATLKHHPQWKELNKGIKSSDEWPPFMRYYYLAKQTAHSSNYGIKAPTFRSNILDKSGGKIVLTKYESEYFLSFYRSTFPEIPKWNQHIMNVVSKTRMLHNLFGHPRYFGGEMDNHFFMEANAFVPQSTVGEITHMCIRDTYDYIEQNDKNWFVLQNNHDSMLNQFPEKEEEEFKTVTAPMMDRELTSPKGELFTMKSEYKSGYNWAFTK